MKKIIIVLILWLLTVVSFSSCSKPKEDPKKFIVGEWILEDARLDNGESIHLFFNANGTLKGIYKNNGTIMSTINGKYYITYENTITIAINGKKKEDYYLWQIDGNEMFLRSDANGDIFFYKRAIIKYL